MNNKSFSAIGCTTLKGITQNAEYIRSPLADYQDNPLIEALPPIYEPIDVVAKIGQFPTFAEQERDLPASLRLHCVMRIADFIQPLTVHLDVEQRISRVIRQGYKGRNPLNPDYKRRLSNAELFINPTNIEGNNTPWSYNASGFTIIGISGIGKTKTVERNLFALSPL